MEQSDAWLKLWPRLTAGAAARDFERSRRAGATRLRERGDKRQTAPPDASAVKAARQNHVAYLRRLGRFFTQVLRHCRWRPLTYQRQAGAFLLQSISARIRKHIRIDN